MVSVISDILLSFSHQLGGEHPLIRSNRVKFKGTPSHCIQNMAFSDKKGSFFMRSDRKYQNSCFESAVG